VFRFQVVGTHPIKPIYMKRWMEICYWLTCILHFSPSAFG